jgi:hypothetical protein
VCACKLLTMLIAGQNMFSTQWLLDGCGQCWLLPGRVRRGQRNPSGREGLGQLQRLAGEAEVACRRTKELERTAPRKITRKAFACSYRKGYYKAAGNKREMPAINTSGFFIDLTWSYVRGCSPWLPSTTSSPATCLTTTGLSYQVQLMDVSNRPSESISSITSGSKSSGIISTPP